MEKHPLGLLDSAGGPCDATPPLHIWAHPRDQSQTTALLNSPFPYNHHSKSERFNALE